MASIIIKAGKLEEKESTEKVAGQLLFSTDQKPNDKIYFDVDDNDRIVLGGKDEVDTELNENSTNPISNKAVAGVMLKTMSEVNTVTTNGQLVDALAVKALAKSVTDLTDKVTNYWKTIYPVGSLYISLNSSFDPSTAFGGTWTKLSGGCALITSGYESTYGRTYSLGSTYGDNYHTLSSSEMPKHTHNTGITRTQPDEPSHAYGLQLGSAYFAESVVQYKAAQASNGIITTSAGGSSAFSTMQKSLACNVWRRTA